MLLLPACEKAPMFVSLVSVWWLSELSSCYWDLPGATTHPAVPAGQVDFCRLSLGYIVSSGAAWQGRVPFLFYFYKPSYQ